MRLHEGPVNVSTRLEKFKSKMYKIIGDMIELVDAFASDRFRYVGLRKNFTTYFNESGIMMFQINSYNPNTRRK